MTSTPSQRSWNPWARRRAPAVPVSKAQQRRELEALVAAYRGAITKGQPAQAAGADLPAHRGVKRVKVDADEGRDWVTLR
jgi:hypothetical protein